MTKWFGDLKNTFSSFSSSLSSSLPFFKKKELAKPVDFLDLDEDEHTAWWGTFGVEQEQSRYAKIGCVVLCIDHYNQEWHIAHYREGQDKAQSKTIAAHIMQGEVLLKPVLPNRSLLFSLENALMLPAKSAVCLYASTPVFIRIDIGNPANFLEEVPTEVLSDTWFGKTTQAGELCYAANHFIANRIEELSRDNTHVITPIAVMNQSPDHVLLKEIKIPAPYLSLFCDPQNHLWTEQLLVTFINHDVSNTTIEKGTPKGLKEITQLSHARYTAKNGFISLFNSR